MGGGRLVTQPRRSLTAWFFIAILAIGVGIFTIWLYVEIADLFDQMPRQGI